jgi:hypothetical protein
VHANVTYPGGKQLSIDSGLFSDSDRVLGSSLCVGSKKSLYIADVGRIHHGVAPQFGYRVMENCAVKYCDGLPRTTSRLLVISCGVVHFQSACLPLSFLKPSEFFKAREMAIFCLSVSALRWLCDCGGQVSIVMLDLDDDRTCTFAYPT